MNESKVIQDILKRLKKLEQENKILHSEIEKLKAVHLQQTLNHKEAAKYLGISSQTLYNWVNLGKVQKVSIGVGKNTYLVTELNKHKRI